MKYFLILFFLMILPVSFAQECFVYSDCPRLDCIGYSRICKENECTYTDCFLNYGLDKKDIPSFQSTLEDYNVKTDNTFGLKPILILSGKVILLVVLSLLLMLLLSVLKVQRSFRAFVVILMVLLIFSLLIFMFGLHEKVLGLFGKNPNQAAVYEKNILEIAQKNGFSVEKRDISSILDTFFHQDIKTAMEFRLNKDNKEICFIFARHKKNITLEDSTFLEIKEYASNNGKKMILGDDTKNIIWQKPSELFFLSGPVDSGVMDELASLGDSSYILFDISLKNNTYTNKKRVHFTINPDVNNIDINGLRPKNNTPCVFKDKKTICDFIAVNQKIGWNNIKLSIEDNPPIYYRFYYDDFAPWVEVEQNNNTYMNTISFYIDIGDEESGLTDDNIHITTNKSLEYNCMKARKHVYECRISGSRLQQGNYSVGVLATDKAGNTNKLNYNFFFDNEAPFVEKIENGFRISDKYALDIGSLRINNKKYPLEECKFNSTSIICDSSKQGIVTINDKAKNKARLII
ncbi:MAG: hypothetical protein ACQESF_06475 [Nanobdellota archaeon]